MRPVRIHRRRRSTGFAPVAIAAGTAAVLIGGLLTTPFAKADPTPAATPSAMERAAEHSAYDKVFADLPADIDLVPLLKAVSLTVDSSAEAVDALMRVAEIVLADVTGFAEGLPELLDSLQDDPAGAIEVLQAALLAQQADLLLAGLPAVLDLLSAIAGPTCYTLGALSAALPARTGVLPLQADLFGPLAPAVEQLDRGVSDALYDLYVELFATLLGTGNTEVIPGLPSEIGGLLGVAQVLLSIFKVDVETTYYQGGDAEPIVRSTPGLLNLPVLLDVDQRVGVDLCALTSLDLGSINLTDPDSLSALELSQTVGRVPLRNKALPVDLNAKALLGALQFGFSAKDTVVPTIVDSTASLAIDGVAGTYLKGAIDTTLTAPGNAFSQTLSIAGAAGNRVAVVDPPSSYRAEVAVAGAGDPSGGNGLQYTYQGAEKAESFTFEQFAGTATQGVTHTPASKELSYCTSAAGFCSNQPEIAAAEHTQSMHLRANEPVRVQEDPLLDALCAEPVVLGQTVRAACGFADVTAQTLNIGAKVPTSASTAGFAWVDTDDLLASGNIKTPVLTGIVATLPDGFKAQDRLASWTGTGTAPVGGKSGTVTCPTNTSVFARSNQALLGGFGLNRYFCVVLPVNVLTPAVSPTSGLSLSPTPSTLTANPRTWGLAPNAPTSFAYQWQRCVSTDVTTCVNIPTATATTYTLTLADAGYRIRVAVIGTNEDGSTTAFSAVTGAAPGTIATLTT